MINNNKRPQVTVIFDGQYGSCGKGAICGYLASDFDVAVRVGGPNAGHTLKIGKQEWKMQQIPVAGLVNKDIILCIGAAGLINIDILNREMKMVRNCDERLFIDRNAGILEERHKTQEQREKMNSVIGSTCEGVGAALRDKIKRDGTFYTASDIKVLRKYITNISLYLNNLNNNSKIMIEGTQGYGLSLNHGSYPYCTGRDTLVSSLLSDIGLAPQLCKQSIMVIRTYPIRVAGNSGPMCGKELTWEEVQARSGYGHKIVEKTTVTKRIRRVCEFNMAFVKEAAIINRPTEIALTFVDYLDHKDYGKNRLFSLSKKSRQFIDMIEDELQTSVTLIKTGPDFKHIIDRRFAFHIDDAYDEGGNI